MIQANIWDLSNPTVYSPLFNSVIFVHGSVKISANIGAGSGQYCNDLGCLGPGTVPQGVWNISIIATGDIDVSGNPSYGSAHSQAGYHFLLVSGRDIVNSGASGATDACASGCSTTTPSNVDTFNGIFAAHEVFKISGNPNILGFLLAEDAIDCSAKVTGPVLISGVPKIFYDCNNPPNPWAEALEILSWQEIE